MNLWILDKYFDQIGVIDDYRSLIWSKRYNELGDCEVYIAANKRSFELLKKGNFILRDDDDMICRIEAIQLDTNTEQGDFLIVTGYDCRKILNQRVIWKQLNYSGTVESFIYKVIGENVTMPANANRKIANFRMGVVKGYPEAIQTQCTFDYVFDKIKEVCAVHGFGTKVSYNGTDFIFDLYKGVDRSIDQTENEVVIFSPEFENLISTNYKDDSTSIKTAALVAGDGEGINRVTEEIEGGTGLNRFELFVDANDVSSEISYADLIATYPHGDIVEENAIVYYVVNRTKVAILDHIDTPTKAQLLGEFYQVLLHQKGVESLAEVKPTITFDGQVEPFYSYKYGEDYFLGDIVTVQNEYGITANARIVEVIESDDENGYSIIPTFEYVVQDIESTEEYLLTETNDILTTENDEPLRY